MTWENKVEMVKLLNNENYEDAVKMFGNEKDWDEQALEMFILGFDLTKIELLKPLKNRLHTAQVSDFRCAMRLVAIDMHFNPY